MFEQLVRFYVCIVKAVYTIKVSCDPIRILHNFRRICKKCLKELTQCLIYNCPLHSDVYDLLEVFVWGQVHDGIHDVVYQNENLPEMSSK